MRLGDDFARKLSGSLTRDDARILDEEIGRSSVPAVRKDELRKQGSSHRVARARLSCWLYD